ncbi:MAG: hypothetical protein WBB25_07735 [Sulfitobacter sp.]
MNVGRSLIVLALMIWAPLATLAENHVTLPDPTPQQDVVEVEQPRAYRLRVGVRSQARPFSYQSETLLDVITAATPGVLAKQNYTGYIARICDAVLNEMLLDPRNPNPLKATDIEIVDVDVLRRDDPGKPPPRFAYLQSNDPDVPPVIDILCDPATITNDRRVGLMISSPVYLTGISYIVRKNAGNRRFFDEDFLCPRPNGDNTKPLFLFGLVGNTTAGTYGVRALIKAQEIPQARDALIDYLKADSEVCLGVGADLAKAQNVTYKGGVRFFRTHAEAAAAFCNGEVIYYIGDREIITAHASTHPACDFEGGDQTYTIDRYAIFGRIDYDKDNDQAKLVARFFEVLSQKIVGNPSILDQAFNDTFSPRKPTPSLDIFFRAVRGTP